MIADVVVTMTQAVARERSVMGWLILFGAFFASTLLDVNIVLIILCCGVLGAARTLWQHRRKGRA